MQRKQRIARADQRYAGSRNRADPDSHPRRRKSVNAEIHQCIVQEERFDLQLHATTISMTVISSEPPLAFAILNSRSPAFPPLASTERIASSVPSGNISCTPSEHMMTRLLCFRKNPARKRFSGNRAYLTVPHEEARRRAVFQHLCFSRFEIDGDRVQRRVHFFFTLYHQHPIHALVYQFLRHSGMTKTEQQPDRRFALAARVSSPPHSVRQRKTHPSARDPAFTGCIAADGMHLCRPCDLHRRMQLCVLFKDKRHLSFALRNTDTAQRIAACLFDLTANIGVFSVQRSFQHGGNHIRSVCLIQFQGLDLQPCSDQVCANPVFVLIRTVRPTAHLSGMGTQRGACSRNLTLRFKAC